MIMVHIMHNVERITKSSACDADQNFHPKVQCPTGQISKFPL